MKVFDIEKYGFKLLGGDTEINNLAIALGCEAARRNSRYVIISDSLAKKLYRRLGEQK